MGRENHFADCLDDLWERARRDRSHASAAILADALTQHGDPRGEFILLQQSARHDAAEEAAALLDSHRAEWLGPFASINAPGSDTWSGGFLRGFTPKGDGSLPPASDPGWFTIETLHLGSCRLEAALPIIDTVHIPLRRLTLSRWSEIRLLASRPSPRRSLGHISTTEWMQREPPDTRFYGPVQLDIGTLEVRCPWGIPPWMRWRNKPPRRVLIPVWWHQFGTRFDELFLSAVAARREAGATVRLTYLHGSFQAMTLDLDPSSASMTLFMRDGHCLVPNRVRGEIATLEPQVTVVGAMGPRTERRVLGRFPGATWRPS